jgi:response regulator RpfG family c-di-GMP phosphodiesterase
MMLTGNAEIEAAMNAVNEGNIFRFLTKPCPKESLIKAVNAGLLQHGLIVAEKELLEKTLHGSMHAITEILSIANPAAFGRSARLERYVRFLVRALKIPPDWRYEIAALLSQLGCVTLHPETIEAVNAGRKLSEEEQERYDKHPAVALDLLSHIPRMQSVAWIILQQLGSVCAGESADTDGDVVKTGASLLRVALKYDLLLSRGESHDEAVSQLLMTSMGLELEAAKVLKDFKPAPSSMMTRMCDVSALTAGMILEEDIFAKNGMLAVRKGEEVTTVLALRLNTFWHHGVVAGDVRVSVATSEDAND